jgi:hypothetical protein
MSRVVASKHARYALPPSMSCASSIARPSSSSVGRRLGLDLEQRVAPLFDVMGGQRIERDLAEAAREWFAACGRGIVRAASVEQACRLDAEKIKVE